ncbi:MAG TPA: GNAT family N-acetyltransferase, partial [Thermomicrobiales bacterium]
GVAVGSGGLIFIQKPPLPSNTSGREGYLMNMYTAPSWRGRGVARGIVGTILAFAREAGVDTVRLHASVPGRPVYERAGFTATDSEMVITLK